MTATRRWGSLAIPLNSSLPEPLIPPANHHTQVTLNVALEGESDFRPQQAFLRLTSRSSGLAAYFAAVKDKQGVLYATASAAEVQKQVREWLVVSAGVVSAGAAGQH